MTEAELIAAAKKVDEARERMGHVMVDDYRAAKEWEMNGPLGNPVRIIQCWGAVEHGYRVTYLVTIDRDGGCSVYYPHDRRHPPA